MHKSVEKFKFTLKFRQFSSQLETCLPIKKYFMSFLCCQTALWNWVVAPITQWLAHLETVVGPSIEDFRERMKCLWKINSLIYVCWDINDMSLNWQTNTFHTFKRRNLVFVLNKSVHLDTHWPGCQFYSWLGRWCTWDYNIKQFINVQGKCKHGQSGVNAETRDKRANL